MPKAKKKEYGSGSFRRRGKKYEYRFSYKDIDGKRKYKSITGRTQRECYSRAEEFFIELERQKLGLNRDNTVAAIMKAKYESDFEMNFMAEQGYHRNLEYLKILESHPIADIPIYDITADDLESYMRYIVKYSNSVIEKLHLQLRQAFKEGVRRGYIAEDLMSLHNIRRPKSNKPARKVRGLTETEQRNFVKTLNDYPVPGHGQTYKKQLLIELYTGMRMGEINALSPEDIDFDGGIIHVHKTISAGIGNRCFISDTTKTDAGNRFVPLNSLVRPVLEDAVKNMKKNPEGVIFYDCRKNKLVDTNQVCCYFNRVAKKSGLDITGQHCLRHTFATRCMHSGLLTKLRTLTLETALLLKLRESQTSWMKWNIREYGLR